MAKGNCTACFEPGQKYKECEDRKKKLEKIKEWKLSQGIVWKNDDGTVTLPDGRTIDASEVHANKFAMHAG